MKFTIQGNCKPAFCVRESSTAGPPFLAWRRSLGRSDCKPVALRMQWCAGTMGVMQPKRYRKRCEQQIGMSIQENFAPLLRNCAQLAAAEEDTDKRTVRRLRHLSLVSVKALRMVCFDGGPAALCIQQAACNAADDPQVAT